MRRFIFIAPLLIAGCAQSTPANQVAAGIGGNAAAATSDPATTPPPPKPAPGKPSARGATAWVIDKRYRCMDGSKMTVRVRRYPDAATITRNGKSLATLPGRQLAQRMVYAKGGYELRSKLNMATLTTPGQPPIACTVIR